MSQRIVITGADGQVGRFLAAVAATQGRAIMPLTRAGWDIADPHSGPELTDGDIVVNCAAYTDVDRAESDVAGADAVNALGAEHVAQRCAGSGARLVHISTDYVFGAADRPARPYEPSDRTAPTNAYGRGKLAGEQAVHRVLPSAQVVRTAWVYTGGVLDRDFVAVMAGRARAGSSVEVVDDQVGSPTYVGDLVTALLQLVDGAVEPGAVLHAANAGPASRFEQAQAVYNALGADVELVRPVSGGAHPRPAPRPSYSVLGAVESAAAGLPALSAWPDALARALGS